MTKVLGRSGSVATRPDSYWRSLQYFNLFRLVMATVFMVATNFAGRLRPFGGESPVLALWVSSLYLSWAILLLLLPRLRRRPSFNGLLTLAVVADILAITLLDYAGGERQNNLSYLLLVVLAAAGLVGQGRLVLFYASIASLALLLDQGYRMLTLGAELSDLTRVAGLSIGFYGTAISAHLLAKRALANEALAEQRRLELNGQLRLNRRIIRDMQDGVLVVDAKGKVRLHNPQVEVLCDTGQVPDVPELQDFSGELAQRYPRWRGLEQEVVEILELPRGRSLRLRYLPPVEGDLAILYLEDLALVDAQARQLKLAALGRLTANMAHEIRNPLAAISHATELMAEDRADPATARLIRIIGENTQRLNRMVTDVLELGRRDHATMETIDLAEFMTAFVDEFEVIQPGAAQIIVCTIEPGVALLFDRGHLTRVLLNLLGNAMRYCRAQPGSIRIHAARLERPADDGVVVNVQDDGPGIHGEQRSHVFEPFFTTRSVGTGLGLYIARELCDANGSILELMPSAIGAHFRMVGRSGDGGER